jgi:hypothetical protein
MSLLADDDTGALRGVARDLRSGKVGGEQGPYFVMMSIRHVAALAMVGLLGATFPACDNPNLTADCIALCRANQASHCPCASAADCATDVCTNDIIQAENETGCSDQYHANYMCLLGDGGPGTCTTYLACMDQLGVLSDCVLAYCSDHSSNEICAIITSEETSGTGGASSCGGASGSGGQAADGGPG